MKKSPMMKACRPGACSVSETASITSDSVGATVIPTWSIRIQETIWGIMTLQEEGDGQENHPKNPWQLQQKLEQD